MSQQNKQKKHIKSVALLVSVLLIVCVTVGGTLAFLIDTDGPITNLFNPSKVTTYVDESFDGQTKKEVKIQNTGDTEAWIRAAIVVTWQDEDGNVYGEVPKPCTDSVCEHTTCGNDYVINYNLGTVVTKDVWVRGDDNFYYYTSPVNPNEYTMYLITEAKQLKTKSVGDTTYYLTVEILGSGIQSNPDRVFNTEWQSSELEVAIVDGVRQLVPVSATQGG